jgi:hypothetical protein
MSHQWNRRIRAPEGANSASVIGGPRQQHCGFHAHGVCSIPGDDQRSPAGLCWKRVPNEWFAADWDLLFCSAGGLSTNVCEDARQVRRTAIGMNARVAAIISQNVSLDSIAG